MSVEQATGLIKKAIEDADFRAALEAAPIEQRRAILAEHGFGDVRLSHLAQALPASAGGELSDEDFAAVAGGGSHVTTGLLAGGGGGIAFSVVVMAAVF